MKLSDDRSKVILDNGRIFNVSAYGGLSVLGAGSRLYSGFDQDIDPYDPDWQDPPVPLSPAERREIADYAIALWREWAKGKMGDNMEDTKDDSAKRETVREVVRLHAAGDMDGCRRLLLRNPELLAAMVKYAGKEKP